MLYIQNNRRSSVPFQFLRDSSRQIQIPLISRGTTALYESKLLLRQKLKNPSKQRLLKLKDPSYILKPPRLSERQNFFKRLDQKYDILMPESLFIFLWNLLVALSILLNLIQAPISLFLTQKVYEDQFSNIISIFLNYLFLFTLIFDMILVRPNLAYYKNGELIINRYTIFKRYVKRQFWIDLIGILALAIYVILGSYMLIYVKALFYAKIYTILKLDKQFVNFLQLNKIMYALYMFFRIIVFFIFIVIWVASVYFAIDYKMYKQQGYYYQNQLLWLNGSSAIDNMDVITSFVWPYWMVYAVYWAMQTATTDGYGDMTPKNPISTFYCNCIILLMTVMFAFFINSVWGIIGQLDQSGVSYYQNWRNLKCFLKQNEFPVKIKDKVSVYFHDVWKNQDNQKQVKEITNSLSQILRNQILVSSNRYMFQGIPIFKELEDFDPQNFRKLISQLTSHIYQVKLAQDQIIYQAGDKNTNLYCLLRGKIKLVFKQNYYNQVEKSIDQKAKFGNQQFFLESPKYCKAVAECYSKVSVLQKSIFMQKLKSFQSLYKKFIKLSQKIKIQNSLELINQKCWFCSQAHDTKQCPTKIGWRNKFHKKDKSLYKVNILQPMGHMDQRKVTYRKGLKSQKIRGQVFKPLENIDEMDLNDKQNQKMYVGISQKLRKTSKKYM